MLSNLLLGTKYPANFVVTSNSLATEASSYVAETDLELMVLKIIDLGVELRRGRLLKDVLLHVRQAIQSVHVLSFEFVLRHLLQAACKYVNEAKGRLAASVDVLSQKLASLDLEEEVLELEEREILTPWLRFQWEILRVVLDLTRNSSRSELIYHDTVLQAFDFCRTFSRKSEFRRLSEMIRYHLVLTVKYPNQVNGILLASSAESHKLAMDVRLAQLSLACDMELWQEAFRTIEDIYGLQIIARKSPRLLASPEYFDKLTRIFAKSGNFLFLAATLSRTEQDLSQMIMATLASPCVALSEEAKEQAERLARIIGLSAAPCREQLLARVSEKLSSASKEVVAVFEAMQKQNIDCVAGIKALEAVIKVHPEYVVFARPCYENMLSKLIAIIRRERDQIELAELKKLAGVAEVRASGLISKFNLELYLALGIKNGFITGLRIDHASGLVKIDRSLLLAEPLVSKAGEQNAWFELVNQMRRLIGSGSESVPACAGFAENASFAELLKAEHGSNLERKTLIERRKEALLAEANERERQEARERALKAQQEAEAERARIAEENARRQREQLERERAEIKKLEAEKRLAEQEKLKEAAGARLNREKQEVQAVRLDHLERAIREQEIPLLEADYDKQKISDREAYDVRRNLILKTARDNHAHDLALKKKFTESVELKTDYSSFLAQVQARRQIRFEAAQAEASARLEEEKQKRRDRIAAELEARRKLEAEREASRMNMAQAAADGPAKYVPPAARSSWRRDEAPAAEVAAPAPAAPVAAEEEPKKGVYVPRHKRGL